jgi:HEAT repeat protein
MAMARTPADLSSQSLVDLFASESAASAHWLDQLDPRRSNLHFDRSVVAYRELRSRGREAQRLLLSLLEHENPSVRADAACYALEFAPETALPILAAMEDFPGNVGAKVLFILDDWRSGEFDLSYLDKM